MHEHFNCQRNRELVELQSNRDLHSQETELWDASTRSRRTVTSSINGRRSWITWSLVFRNANIIRKQAVFCCFSAILPHILSTKLSTEEFLLSLPRSTDPNEGPSRKSWWRQLNLIFAWIWFNRMKKFKEYRSSGCLVVLILNASWAYLINRTINFTTASRA